jgi:hypothetical protein
MRVARKTARRRARRRAKSRKRGDQIKRKAKDVVERRWYCQREDRLPSSLHLSRRQSSLPAGFCHACPLGYCQVGLQASRVPLDMVETAALHS